MKFSAAALSLFLVVALPAASVLLTACGGEQETVAAADPKLDDALIQKYLTANQLTGAQKQASGLYYVPITANPTGARATAGRQVAVRYTGQLLDGTVFDASSKHGDTPFTFELQGNPPQVIAGWDEGIALMHQGEKAVLLIPSALAYGTNSPSSAIPANAVLRFEVELVEVK